MADIQNMTEGWKGHSGKEVQKFLKQQIAAAQAVAGTKVGYVEYTGGQILFYDKEDASSRVLLSSVTLSGDVYRVEIAASEESTFNVLASDTSKTVTFSAQSYRAPIGGDMVEYAEDHTYVIGIDNGSGTFTTIQSGTILSGKEGTVNIRRHLTTGENRMRISCTGTLSGQQTSRIFTVNLTTLTLDVQFTWRNAWVQNQAFAIDGIYFAGNLQKTLYIAIDDVANIIAQPQFPSGTNYVTSPYNFDMSQMWDTCFPDGLEASGIHTLYVWMEGGGVSTAVHQYNMMCVLAEEANTAQLVVLNDVLTKVPNYTEDTWFDYATYNVSEIGVAWEASDGISTLDYEETISNVKTQTKYSYRKMLEFETESASATVAVTITYGTQSQTLTMGIDNSTAFLPTTGATFYMNAANRSNSSADREYINNIAQGAEVEQYQGVWDKFAWGDTDGWATDSDGNKALVVKAGSSVSFAGLTALDRAGTESVTIELKFRVSNIADYDTPILTFAPVSGNDGYTQPGLYLTPSKLTLLSSANTDKVLQSIGLEEDTIHHIVIVLQRNYAATGNNLCSVYMNGIRNIHFEYAGTAVFGSSSLAIGQSSTDIALYMMRFYAKALESGDVLANFINTIIDGDEFTRSGVRDGNAILDGTTLDYEMAKKAGYSCMVVEFDGDLPDVNHQEKNKTCTLRMEYAERDTRNFTVTNMTMNGQGTTSMQYYRWNLRFKAGSGSVWSYGDGTTSTGKKGWFDGRNHATHAQVGDIVAKKNYASAMQGHKMGAVGLYDELYRRVIGTAGLPDKARVAVYQYPVLGFQRFQDGTYKYIGLYTIGPHKGDKGTFGYDGDTYPMCMSLEGPNHAPLGTRFLHAWQNVDYDVSQETLTFGGEEGWDADFMGNLETDDAANKNLILQRYTSEWKPAYEIVYFCSPYLRSLTDLGTTIAAINADVVTFRGGKTDGMSNALLQIYDASDYSLYSYNNATQTYVEVVHDMLDYLGDYLNTSTPTTAELIEARRQKFRAEAQTYWQVPAVLFHYCFCALIGATDNFAKNMYPFKFTTLAEGGKWSFRQDDLDSILDTDNNGQQTKPYHVLPGDVNAGGAQIYQGGDSALWRLVENAFPTEIKNMMRDIVAQCSDLATTLGIGGNLHDALYNIFEYYFWAHSAKYFPAESYNKDTEWCYIEPWRINHNATYNGVRPLTQARGDAQYSEREWVTKHIAFVFSRYQIGGFSGGSSLYGSFSFTPSAAFTFQCVPAIDLYPGLNSGGNGSTSSGTDIQGARTAAGEVCQLTVPSGSSTTNVYLEGTDWLSYYGDVSGLAMNDRGGGSGNPESVSFTGKRLRKIKCGDAVAVNVLFNAQAIYVSDTPLLEEIDARNTAATSGEADLTQCTRLRRVLFAGSHVTQLYLPVGAQLTEVSLPDTLQVLFFNSLPTMSSSILTIPAACKSTILSLYVANCPQLDALGLLVDIFEAGGDLQYISLTWDGTAEGQASYFNALYKIAQGKTYGGADREYGYVAVAATGKPVNMSDGIPVIEGSLYVDDYINAKELAVVEATWPNLHVTSRGAVIDFEDAEVKRICVENWGGETGGSTGIAGKAGEITTAQAAAVSSVGTIFKGNTVISKFNELYYFEDAKLPSNCFMGCTSLTEASIPKKMTALAGGNAEFKNCTALRTLYFPEGYKSFGYSAFEGNSNLALILPTTFTTIGNSVLYSGSNYTIVLKTTTPQANSTGLSASRVKAVYVPDEAVADYKASWTNFATKIYPLSEYDGSIVSPVW